MTERPSASTSTGELDFVGQRLGVRLVEIVRARKAPHLGAALALDENLHGAVGQFQQLQHGRERADRIDRVGRRIVVAGVVLRREQNWTVGPGDLLQGANRFVASDKQRDDHVGKHDDIAQGKDREALDRSRRNRAALFARHLFFLKGYRHDQDTPWRSNSGAAPYYGGLFGAWPRRRGASTIEACKASHNARNG